MKQQEKVLAITAELWNSFLDIDKKEVHPDDINDVRFHINAIQSILFTQLYKIDNEVKELKKTVPKGLIKR